jgi:hypothetical protein
MAQKVVIQIFSRPTSTKFTCFGICCRVSVMWGVERVCSGISVPNIYEFLRDEEKIPERREVAQLIASGQRPYESDCERCYGSELSQ